MKIKQITEQKKKYLSLLLLADEQESMIDRYLNRGTMYALVDNDTIGICVVTEEDSDTLEIKNIAIEPRYQNKGYGKTFIDMVCDVYKDEYQDILVGTSDIPWIISFYEKCGFRRSHEIENFFIENYDHPMYEDGQQLINMVYLKRDLNNEGIKRSKYNE